MKQYYFIPYLRQTQCVIYTENFFPNWKNWGLELLRPWKLVTFFLGLTFLLYGAAYWDYMDWNWLNSVVMACLTYLMAPWATYKLIYRKNLLHTLCALVVAFLVIDTSYAVSNRIMGAPVFHIANFGASTMLFFSCGFLWLYCSSLKELFFDIRKMTQNVISEK